MIVLRLFFMAILALALFLVFMGMFSGVYAIVRKTISKTEKSIESTDRKLSEEEEDGKEKDKDGR